MFASLQSDSGRSPESGVGGCFPSLLTQALCKEDSNLFVMEMDGEAIMEDDATPLYKTRFLDTNNVSIVFEVCVGFLPDARASASCFVACGSWSSASGRRSSGRRSVSRLWTDART